MCTNTPEQAKAIANQLRSARARWSKRDGYTVRDFPKWQPGMSTSGYVRLFAEGRCNVLNVDWNRIAERPAPYLTPEQDAVIVEVDDE